MQQPERRPPVEPPTTRWELPSPRAADRDGIAGIGGDLEPGTLLEAYRRGLFPMPFGRRRLAWFSPDPRAVIPLDGLAVSRSLRRSVRRYDVRRDTAFGDVILHCADPRRPGSWITPAFVAPTGSCICSDGRTRSSAMTRRERWSAGSTACASAPSSPARRCSIALATPPRWHSSSWSAGCRRPAGGCSTCSG